jgi:hypothetical protein
MSQENVEWIEQFFKLYNRREIDRMGRNDGPRLGVARRS